MTSPLTPHQAAILRAIRRYQWQNRSSPSLTDLCRINGTSSTNAVAKTVRTLKKLGQLETGPKGTILFPREALNADYFRPFQP